jgi:hypothetical protein
MNQSLSTMSLRQESILFIGSAGVSEGNRSGGFMPAFCDMQTGRVEFSRFANGAQAPIHMLDGLPAAWVVTRSASGRVSAVKGCVISGFVRDRRFYTRQQAKDLSV